MLGNTARAQAAGERLVWPRNVGLRAGQPSTKVIENEPLIEPGTPAIREVKPDGMGAGVPPLPSLTRLVPIAY